MVQVRSVIQTVVPNWCPFVNPPLLAYKINTSNNTQIYTTITIVIYTHREKKKREKEGREKKGKKHKFLPQYLPTEFYLG